MARYQIIIAYDGTRFAGSQRQAHGAAVQAELERALTGLGWQGKSILMAGRTDSGVHAAGQVAAADLDWPHSENDLRNALNASLPADIAARDVRQVARDFHPRFDAISRRYRYRLFHQPVRDPLRERFAWRISQEVDGELLRKAPKALLGTHDFASFGSPPKKGGSTTRTVLEATWSSLADEWALELEANAFLYRMVRRMVYIQVAVAQGKLPLRAIRDALSGKDGLPAGLAPAHGLTLVQVSYPADDDRNNVVSSL